MVEVVLKLKQVMANLGPNSGVAGNRGRLHFCDVDLGIQMRVFDLLFFQAAIR
jgi:hypothetical protein